MVGSAVFCREFSVYMLETRLSKQSQHSHASHCSSIFSHSIMTRQSRRGRGLRSTSVFTGVQDNYDTEVKIDAQQKEQLRYFNILTVMPYALWISLFNISDDGRGWWRCQSWRDGEPLLWTAQAEGTAEFFSILRVRLVDSVEIVSAKVITPLEQFYPGALTSLINEGYVGSYLFNQHVYRQKISRIVDMMIYHHKDKHKLTTCIVYFSSSKRQIIEP